MEKKKRGRKPKKQITGLGDVVAVIAEPVAEVLNLKDENGECKIGCKERQKRWNRLFPFYKKPTEEDLTFLKDVFSWYKGLPISPDKVNDIIKCEDIYIRLFNVKNEPCRGCGAVHQNNYMEKLKDMYENYI
jgi:hypothetical protein